EMKKYGYSPGLSGGSIAIGGTLGVVIPPSTALIIIAIQSEQSITQLFTAAVLPGFIVGVALVATVLLLCWRRPHPGPPGPKVSWGRQLRALTGVLEVVFLLALVIGGMAAGWFPRTGSGPVGQCGTLLIGMVTASRTLRQASTTTVERRRISAMVLRLSPGAVGYGRVLRLTRLPF